MASNEQRLITEPERIDLGSVQKGSRLTGSFLIPRASSCLAPYCVDCGGSEECEKAAVPGWLMLDGPMLSRRGLLWRYDIHVDQPGPLSASLVVACDSGTARVQVSLDVRSSETLLGDLAICDSPFSYHVPYLHVRSLVRLLGALPFRIRCLESSAEIAGGDFDDIKAIILHQTGLISVDFEQARYFRYLVDGGVRLVLFADHFYQGTAAAVNRIAGPLGLHMSGQENDLGDMDGSNKRRRMVEWSAQYERSPFVCCGREIAAHPLTNGVRRLMWDRPCPIFCNNALAMPLVRSPIQAQECFCALIPNVSNGERGSVVVVGSSLVSSLASVGWPFDNDRLFANLVVGGDAESALHGELSES
jgi:hypothetical protein